MNLSMCIRTGAAMAAIFITRAVKAADGIEKLTNKEGKEIRAVVGRIKGKQVSLTVAGKTFSIPLESLSESSRKRVQELDAKRINEAGDRREYWARRAELKNASIEFRGLWIGMTMEEADMLEESTLLHWKKEPESKDKTGHTATLDFTSVDDIPREKLGELLKLATLAENSQGDPFLWTSIQLSFESDALYYMGIAGPPVDYSEVKLSVKTWLGAVKAALVQKYGKPESEESIEDFSGIGLRPGFASPLASWKVAGKFSIELQVAMQENGRYYGLIDFVDPKVESEIKARKEKIKGGL